MVENAVSQEVAWNLSQAIVDEIAILLSSSVSNYIHYNFEVCFRNLKAIKMIVIANLGEDERDEFTKMEEELTPLLNKISIHKSGFKLDKQIKFSKENGKNITEKIDEYSEYLMDTLKRYGYLIPAKENRTNLNK